MLDAGAQSGIQRGLLVIRNFEVRNEGALSNLDEQGRSKKASGPRRDGLSFTRLTLPFSADQRFVRIGDALVQGSEMGASAQGIIRKADGRMDIGGTIIPAYALNAALSEVPVLGEVLMGGRGQGVFGLNFALQGTMQEPRFVVNPVSAIAPGLPAPPVLDRRRTDQSGRHAGRPKKAATQSEGVTDGKAGKEASRQVGNRQEAIGNRQVAVKLFPFSPSKDGSI